MDIALVLLGAVLSPLVALALLLWLSHLEETLPTAVESARRRPDPAPILAISLIGRPDVAAQALEEPHAVSIPGQRVAPDARPAPVVT